MEDDDITKKSQKELANLVLEVKRAKEKENREKAEEEKDAMETRMANKTGSDQDYYAY